MAGISVAAVQAVHAVRAVQKKKNKIGRVELSKRTQPTNRSVAAQLLHAVDQSGI